MKKLVKINTVKGNPNNPRIIKDDKFHSLVKSINEFPKMLEKRPIVVDQDMIVLGGNMRLKACIEAGLKEIWIDSAEEWTDDEKREFIVKDNESYGEWDTSMLSEFYTEEELSEWGLDISFNNGLENSDYDDLDLDDVGIPSATDNTVRGIMVPVVQENYEDCFRCFQMCLKGGVDIGGLFHKLVKNESNKIGEGKGS